MVQNFWKDSKVTMKKSLEEHLKEDQERFLTIGNFVYLFSHVENQIRAYFCSLFPEYTKDLCMLNPDNGINTESLLNISQKIRKNRQQQKNKEFNKLAEEFRKNLIPARKKILHGCWGITGGLTKSPRKLSNQKNREENRYHFFDINEIVYLNTQCKNWVTDFNTVTGLPFKERVTNWCYLQQYFIVIGEFVVHFSQLENAIRWCVADLYKMNEDAFIFCEDSLTLPLLEDLSCNLSGAYIGMKDDFIALNKQRNTLIHHASKFPKEIKDISLTTEKTKKSAQSFTNLFLQLPATS